MRLLLPVEPISGVTEGDAWLGSGSDEGVEWRGLRWNVYNLVPVYRLR